MKNIGSINLLTCIRQLRTVLCYIIIFFSSCSMMYAQFSRLTDNSTHNRFLSATGNNGSLSELFKLNFLSPEFLGQQIYIFNDFTYWMGDRFAMGKWNGKDSNEARQQARAAQQPDKYFSGSGIFMITIGTSSYVQNLVAPGKKCPEGQTLLAAQLKYNDGNSIACWSQDAICLAPTDRFEIAVTTEEDTTVPVQSQAKPNGNSSETDWMKDPGPSANYKQAGNSPRKIRLIRK